MAASGSVLGWSSSVSWASVVFLSVATPGVSLVSTPVGLTVPLSSGGISTITSTSKLCTPGVLMRVSSTPDIVLSTPRIAMYYIYTPVRASIVLSYITNSSTTPVSTSSLRGSASSSFSKGFWDLSSKVRSSSVCASMVASYLTRLITEAGTGTTHILLKLVRFPVVSKRKV